MISERALSLITTLALVPATRGLLHKGSPLGFIYLASFVVTIGYHASLERRFRLADHVLAWGVILTNCYMVWAGRDRRFALAGCVFVVLALIAYVDARTHADRYDRSHALWHILSGVAGFLFVLGYG